MALENVASSTAFLSPEDDSKDDANLADSGTSTRFKYQGVFPIDISLSKMLSSSESIKVNAHCFATGNKDLVYFTAGGINCFASQKSKK